MLMRDNNGPCSCLHQLDGSIIAAQADGNSARLEKGVKLGDVIEQKNVPGGVFLLKQKKEFLFFCGCRRPAGDDEAVTVAQDGLGLNGIDDDLGINSTSATADNNGVFMGCCGRGDGCCCFECVRREYVARVEDLAVDGMKELPVGFLEGRDSMCFFKVAVFKFRRCMDKYFGVALKERLKHVLEGRILDGYQVEEMGIADTRIDWNILLGKIFKGRQKFGHVV